MAEGCAQPQAALGDALRAPEGAPPVPCGHCGDPTDPLRATRVAVVDQTFFYFCSLDCRSAFVFRPSLDIAERAATPPPALPTPGTGTMPKTRVRPRALASASSTTLNRVQPNVTPLWASAVFALAALAVTWVRPSFFGYATSLTAISAVLLAASTGRREPGSFRVHLTQAVAPAVVACACVLALVTEPNDIFEVALVGASICLSICIGRFLSRFHEAKLRNSAPLLFVTPDPSEHSAGETAELEAPYTLRCDATVLRGNAQVYPWPGAKQPVNVTAEDTLYSGAQLVEGSVGIIVRRTGAERARERLVSHPNHRADEHTALARLCNWLSLKGAFLLGTVLVVSASLDERHPQRLLLVFACGFALLANAGLKQWVAVLISTRVRHFVSRGIFFRDPAGLDTVALAPSVVLTDRGTLLHDAPQVGNVEPIAPHSKEEILALAAGGYADVASPEGRALRQAALDHGVEPRRVRTPQFRAGLGIVAVTSEGESLTVGTHALLLAQLTSLAVAESRITQLEKLGRSVILVSLQGRLIGLLALQDRLRQGVQGAVHHLLRAHIEPILLSSKSRETCEALARSSEIEHFRPNVLPEARAQEIRNLAASRTPLIVVGSHGEDTASLEAASFAINLNGAGTPPDRWGAEVTSGTVQDATFAIAKCKALRATCQRILWLNLTTVAGASAVIGIAGLMWIAPLAIACATLLCWSRVRTEPVVTQI